MLIATKTTLQNSDKAKQAVLSIYPEAQISTDLVSRTNRSKIDDTNKTVIHLIDERLPDFVAQAYDQLWYFETGPKDTYLLFLNNQKVRRLETQDDGSLKMQSPHKETIYRLNESGNVRQVYRFD